MSNKLKRIIRASKCAKNILNIGYGNGIAVTKVVAILEANSLPNKRLREQASKKGYLLDGTAGKKTRSLIVTDSNHVVLSALAPQTLQDRLNGEEPAVRKYADIELEDGEFVS